MKMNVLLLFVGFFFACNVFATPIEVKRDEIDDDDDESGSGIADEDIKLHKPHVQRVVDTMKKMHNAKTNEDLSESLQSDSHRKPFQKGNKKLSDGVWIPMIHKLWKFWHKRGSFLDLGSVNLMTEATGARQVMHTIASKLVSHTSNKITNHVGSIIKSNLVDRKSDVSTDISKKSLSSATEVVLPAVAFTKLSESGASNSTLAPSNTSLPVNQSTSQRNAIPDDSSNENATQGTGSKVESIGPMEGIEINIKGTSDTFNNFTKLHKEPEVNKPSKLEVLKFDKGHVSENNKQNSTSKKSTLKKSMPKKVKKEKKYNQKKKQPKKSKKSKSSKKHKVEKFPKIILYQGPISKALENILKARSSPYTPHIINAPMSFAEATRDIKRSNIARANAYKKNGKLLRNDDDENDDEEEEDEEEMHEKKSKVAAKGQRKYTVKGYHDNGKADKKSVTKKNMKQEDGKNSKTSSLNGKRKETVPKANYPSNDAGDENEQIFPEFPKREKIKSYKPSIVPNEVEPSATQFSDFIKQMAMPISSSDIQFFPRNPQHHTKTLKDRYKSAKNSKPNSIIGNQPKPSSNVFEGQLSETNADNNNKEAPNDGYQLEYPNPAGYTTMGGQLPPDQDGDDDDDDDDDTINESNNGTNSTQPHIVQTPLEQNPAPSINNPGAPKPVSNAPDFGKQSPPIPNHKPNTNGPLSLHNPNTQPSLEGNNPSPQPQADLDDDKPDDLPEIQNPKPIGLPMGSKPIGLPVPDNLPSMELESDLMERVQSNSHNIASLANEVRDVESRLEEVGTAVDHIEKDLERIESKLVAPKAAGIKPSTNLPGPFTNLPGPFSNLQNINPSANIPIELITGGKFPIKIPSSGSRFRRPKILKQFFVPLPPPNSQAAKQIENGAPVQGLPWPLNEVVSFLMRKLKKFPEPSATSQGFPFRMKSRPRIWQHPPQVLPDIAFSPREHDLDRPQVLPDIAFPPREHDLDRLELEMGKMPITRVGNGEIMQKKPKIIFLSKAPNMLDLTEKPCDEPCENGGECMGGNVCKCPPMFSGPKCTRATHRSSTPHDIMELLSPIPFDTGIEAPKKSHDISLPFVLTDNEEDNENQKTMGQVEQSKIVDLLSQFSKHVQPEFVDVIKRDNIPHNPRIMSRYSRRYPEYRRQLYRK